MTDMRFVYLVRCKDGSLYTGITTDLEKRVLEHNTSKLGAKYTKSRRPVTLVWFDEVENRNEATRVEREIKKLPKEKKEGLVYRAKEKKITT